MPQATAREGAGVADAPVVIVAGFWRRLLAGLADTAVVLPVALLLALVAGKISGIAFPPARHAGIDYWLDLALAGDPALWGIVGLVIAIGTLYLVVFQAMMGRTLGMRLLRLRIIDVYGDAPGLARAAIRAGGHLACLATLGLGYVWIGFDREKRGFHDWIAGTYVIRARAGG
jgi:uncharacterized RDD family membrane protein YckC